MEKFVRRVDVGLSADYPEVRDVDFGIMFFFSAAQKMSSDKYKLLIEAARFADRHEFSCVWTPERHFHEFGGLFPNPSVTSAALAMVTENLQIRAGSLISPLHHPTRIAEEWSVVDNLSNGRVGISFGSGWNIDDFIIFPERYANRHELMYRQMEIVKRLWRGEQIVERNSTGKEVGVSLYPQPVQKSLPVWVTSSGNSETFVSAGKIGANILTHLIGQDIETLADKIRLYREALPTRDLEPHQGKVSLMLHTFMGPDAAAVKDKVREPFREYLRSAISLEEKASAGGGVISGGHKIDPHQIPPDVMEELLDLTFERYFHHASLLGTPAGCKQLIWRLKEIGVDEVACLIDFLPNYEAVMESLVYVNELRAAFSPHHADHAGREMVNTFLEDLEG